MSHSCSVTVTNLAARASVTIPHTLSDWRGALVPDRIYPHAPTCVGVTACDAAGITFYNWGNCACTAIFTVERRHSIEGGHTDPAGIWTGGPNPDGLLWGSVNHVTIGNTDVETTMLDSPGIGSLIVPANFFYAGRCLEWRIRGVLSCGNGQQSTFRVKFGNVTLITSVGTLPNGLINMYVEAVYDLLCHSAGIHGSIDGAGRTLIQMAAGINSIAMRALPEVDAEFDTTQAAAFDVTYQWTTKDPGNTVTLTHSRLRVVA